MKIGELALRAGVTIDTVRFYERRGLLPRASRTRAGYRSYSGVEVERLRLIKSLQGLGISLDEAAQMLKMVDEGSATCENQTPRFEAVVDRIDAELERLRAVREALASLLAPCRAGRCTLPSGSTQPESDPTSTKRGADPCAEALKALERAVHAERGS